MSHDGYDKFWRMIDTIRVAMLTTDDDGVLRSRPMLIFPEQDQDRLVMFAGPDQAVIAETSPSAPVNLSFVDRDKGDYVSASGTARVKDDPDKAARLWSQEAAQWFAADPDTDDLRLVEVELTQGEIWDQSGRAMKRVWPFGEPGAAAGAENATDNRKVTLR